MFIYVTARNNYFNYMLYTKSLFDYNNNSLFYTFYIYQYKYSKNISPYAEIGASLQQ